MKVLGIDPGTATVGYGLIHCLDGQIAVGDVNARYSTINTDKDKRDELRLKELFEQITDLIRSMNPDVIVLEKLFFARNVTTAIGVGQARGVILLACEQAAKPVFEYTPMQVKQQITGYGKADKKQIIAMTKKILEIDQMRTKIDDAWDGLAIALTHCYRSGLAAKPQYLVSLEKNRA